MKRNKESMAGELLRLINGDSISDRIRNSVNEIDKIRKVAIKHRKSLSGDNHYGNKFHEVCININKEEVGLDSIVENRRHSGLADAFKLLNLCLESICNPNTSKRDFLEAKRNLSSILNTKIEPFIGNGVDNEVPTTNSVILIDIVKETKEYIEKVALQVNGCYEHGYYDACAVMIRRLIETLIIECFEHHKITDKIKDKQGNYFYLKDLIDTCLKESIWTLSRSTKSVLGKLKNIGDQSAHNRRYLARKNDIDKVCDDLRVAVEEFVHLLKLK